MKPKDIRDFSVEDIMAKIAEEEKNFLSLKMGHKVSHIENPLDIRNTRREIARLKTILKEKQAQK